MKRHLQGIALALALLPTFTFAQPASQAAPASAVASTPGYASALKAYVRPEVPTSSPEKEWLEANRALREDGDMDMGGMQMGGMQMGAKPMDGKAMKDMPMGDKPMSAMPMHGMLAPGIKAPKPAASAPVGPHAGHQMKNNGH